MMSSDTLLQKFNRLDPQAQDQLLTFWDFLLAQSGEPPAAMSEAYRRAIQQVGVWTEEDLRPVEEAASRWQWQAPEW